jgi:hypothetical protein
MEQWPKSACMPIEGRPTGPLVADRGAKLLLPSPRLVSFRRALGGGCGGYNYGRLLRSLSLRTVGEGEERTVLTADARLDTRQSG